jgi:hypothetical protein
LRVGAGDVAIAPGCPEAIHSPSIAAKPGRADWTQADRA